MTLPNSAKNALGCLFYSLGKTPDAIDDLMSILKILDFRWDTKNQILIDENTERPIPREVRLGSPWSVIPIKNLSNFDLDCLEKVLNTRIMKELPVGRLSPLFECIGWQMKKEGDTYRLHYVGGNDYWETSDYWKTDWKEPWDDEFPKDDKGLPIWEDETIPKEWV